VFERFVARQAIFNDNLTLLGYDPRFRGEAGSATPENSPGAYFIDSATTAFHWETLIGCSPAFVVLGEQELLQHRVHYRNHQLCWESLEKFTRLCRPPKHTNRASGRCSGKP
jgi:c-di-GMP-related signal transduction protein